MDKQFFIKKGSLCFIVPVFTEKSKFCNELLNKLKKDLQKIDNDGKGTVKASKDNLIKRIKVKVKNLLLNKLKINLQKMDNGGNDTVEASKDNFIKRTKVNIEKFLLNKLENNNDKKDIIKKSKDDFIKRIKGYFSNIKESFCSNECQSCQDDNKGNNSRRYLCNCIASAVKFHDDISQRKNTLHFHLDNFKITYEYNDLRCCFKINVILYLMHDDDEKVAYLLFEINMADIENFCMIEGTDVPDDCIKSEQIIFIKHLFYKRKMQVQIACEESPRSLQEWGNGYVEKLCKALGLDPGRDVPKYIEKHAFKYSFIELKELCDENGKELDVDFNNMDNFLDNYSRQTYGLLLSDEGWASTPEHVVKSKLQDYWTTRDYVCTFFLQHNALLFDLKTIKRGKELSDFSQKWFSNYQDNKYKDYVSNHPCLTGIDTLAIFPFLSAIYKDISIDKYKCKYKNESEKDTASSKIKNARNELNLLQNVLNKYSLNLGEMASMEKCIYRQFGLIEETERIREIYNQQVDKLNFDYNEANNNKISFLTKVTIMLSAISIILSAISIWISDEYKIRSLVAVVENIVNNLWKFIEPTFSSFFISIN